jgi:hypothetical protein
MSCLRTGVLARLPDVGLMAWLGDDMTLLLKRLAQMKPADRLAAARRLLDDQLVMGILEALEADAINAMVEADSDERRREARDTVKTVRGFKQALQRVVNTEAEARREPVEVV